MNLKMLVTFDYTLQTVPRHVLFESTSNQYVFKHVMGLLDIPSILIMLIIIFIFNIMFENIEII